MSKFIQKGWRYFVVTTFVLSVAATSICLNFFYSQTPQWQDYTQGWFLYRFTIQYSWALQAFDRSMQDYDRALLLKDDPFTGRPSLELAELALHFKALAEIKMGTKDKMHDALDDLNRTLTLTIKTELDQAEKDGRLDPSVRAQVEKDRQDDQVNVEILQNNKPQLAKGQGKGKGQPEEGDGKDGDDPNGGNSAGKPTREEM
jgi:hypothetical protein